MRWMMVVVTLVLAPLGALADVASPWTTLTLTESATRSAAADHLTARLRIEVQGEDPRALQAEINRQMASALERVRGEPDVRAEGGSYYVTSMNPEPDERAASRWTAVQELSLSGDDAGKVMALAGALQEHGFVFSDLRQDLGQVTQREMREALLREATARLRATAEATAEGLGLRFVGWNRVSLLGGPEPPRFRMAMSAEAMPAPSTAGAEIEVTVTIEGEARLAQMP